MFKLFGPKRVNYSMAPSGAGAHVATVRSSAIDESLPVCNGRPRPRRTRRIGFSTLQQG